jgi:hypothetical protein
MATTQKKTKRNAKPVKTQDELRVLKAENAHLKKELTELTTKKTVKKHRRSFWFSFFAGLSAVVAVTTFMLFNLSYWTQQTIVDNKKFTAAVSPIIQDQDVQKALQTEISKQIFTRINVEQELQQILPENLQFIAAPLASQFESFATAKIGDALKSDQVQQAWTTTLSTVHGKLMDYIQNPQNDGKITVDDIYKTVGDQLSSSQIGFLFGKNLPSSIGSVTVKEVTWLPKARQYLNLLDKLTKELAIATVVATALAIGLARRRVNMVIGLIVFSGLFMLATLAAIKTGYLQVDGIVKNNDYDAAAKAVYSIISSSLVAQTQGFLALLGSFLIVLFVVSPLDWVVWLRTKFTAGLDWLTIKLPFSFNSPNWLHWASSNKAVIAWTLTAVMYASFALRLPPTVSGVVTALVASLVSVVVLEIAASIERTRGHKHV